MTEYEKWKPGDLVVWSLGMEWFSAVVVQVEKTGYGARGIVLQPGNYDAGLGIPMEVGTAVNLVPPVLGDPRGTTSRRVGRRRDLQIGKNILDFLPKDKR